jgi:hypothetical protein
MRRLTEKKMGAQAPNSEDLATHPAPDREEIEDPELQERAEQAKQIVDDELVERAKQHRRRRGVVINRNKGNFATNWGGSNWGRGDE